MFYTNIKCRCRSKLARAIRKKINLLAHLKSKQTPQARNPEHLRMSKLLYSLTGSHCDQKRWTKFWRSEQKSNGNLSCELRKISPHKEEGQGKKVGRQNAKEWRGHINKQVELRKKYMYAGGSSSSSWFWLIKQLCKKKKIYSWLIKQLFFLKKKFLLYSCFCVLHLFLNLIV